MPTALDRRTDTRQKIVEAASGLLRDGGPEALTTRAAAEAAGVQAPAIYRLFGDKDGLLEAVAEHVMAAYVAAKATTVEAARTDGVDPLDDLREGWLLQVDFALANPSLFRLLSDPDRVRSSPAAAAGRTVLAARVRRVAESGRLRVTEGRAVDLIQAAGVGVIQTLLATPAERRDPDLAEAMYATVLAEIHTEALARPADATREAAIALRAAAPRLEALSPAERLLLADWLDRLVGPA